MARTAIQKKTVLITGCSTGSIGWALTKCFLEHDLDFHVFAGVRSRSKARDLAELSNVDLVELDVTVSQTILQCKELVAERTCGRLDVLVGSPIPYGHLASHTRLPTTLKTLSLLTVTRSIAPGSRGSVHS